MLEIPVPAVSAFSVVSDPRTFGTHEEPVISASRTLGTHEYPAISAPRVALETHEDPAISAVPTLRLTSIWSFLHVYLLGTLRAL